MPSTKYDVLLCKMISTNFKVSSPISKLSIHVNHINHVNRAPLSEVASSIDQGQCCPPCELNSFPSLCQR